MAVEVELKLQLPRAAKADFLRLPLLNTAATPPLTHQLINIYFDTPDLALTRQRMAIRLRKKDGQWLQTVKHGGTSGAGLHQRPEIEQPVPAATLDLARITDPALSRFLLRPEIGPALQPVFTTNFERTTWELQGENGSLIELALDDGEIESNGRTTPLLEVELELKKGDISDLFKLAFQLAAAVPLIADARSKAQRGYALYQDRPPAPVHAAPPRLEKEMTPVAALQAAMAETMRQLQANVQGLLASDDPEFVHQARVAFRRLRTLEKIFAPLLPAAGWQEITESIKTLAGALGQARDWQVLLAETLPSITVAWPDPACPETLKKHLRQQRDDALVSARQAFQAIPYGQLLLRLLIVLQLPSPEECQQASLCDFAEAALKKREKAWQHLARDWDSLDSEGRHELRKKTKKLRYAGEYLGSLYKPRAVNDYAQSLQRLQSLLGDGNDAVAGQRLLAQMGAQLPAIGYCAGLAAGWLAARQAGLEDELRHTIKHLQHEKGFW
jgi:triphosphatase